MLADIRNVASTIEEKVIKKGQTKRVVLNNYPIEGLEEVLIVKGGQVKSIYP